jgi:parallel beta-helix repeat protein
MKKGLLIFILFFSLINLSFAYASTDLNISEDIYSWQDAKDYCTNIGEGWHLAVIDNATENELIRQGLNSISRQGWLDGNDIADEDYWVWGYYNNVLFSYHNDCQEGFYCNWDGAGEPGDDGDCLLMGDYEYGTWHDFNCDGLKAAVCELESPQQSEYCGGNIECECGDILNESYVMNNHLTGCLDKALIIGEDDLTLDCNGYSIFGINQGVSLYSKNGTTIKNCNFQPSYIGINFNESSNNIIENNNFTQNDKAINLDNNSDSNVIRNNRISNIIGIGINLANSSLSHFYNNEFIENNIGIGVFDSSYNMFEKNLFWRNSLLSTIEGPNSLNNAWNSSENGNYWDDFESNSGYPDYYEIQGDGNGKDYLPTDIADYAWCGDIVTENLTLINDLSCIGDALVIDHTDFVTIDCNGHSLTGPGNNAMDTHGIHIIGSSNATIKNCNINEFTTGLKVYLSGMDYYNQSGVNIINNSFMNNTNTSIYTRTTDFANISDNRIYGSNFGIILMGGNNGDVYNNIIQGNGHTGLTINPRNYPTNNNTIWDNRFLDNYHHTQINESGNNFWNSSENGNYWDDFESNPGYPNYYEVGENWFGEVQIDWFPNGPIVSQVSPFYSYLTLTNGNYNGLTTCPGVDGPEYQYLRAVIKDSNDQPLQGISAENFSFIVNPLNETEYYENLSLLFIPHDLETDSNGEIRFKIKSETSIAGNVSIQAIVGDVLIDDQEILLANTFDRNLNGEVDVSDFALFAGDYGDVNWLSDYNWDGSIDIADFSMFAGHYGHYLGNLITREIPKKFDLGKFK